VEVATCTTPSTQDAAIKPILNSIGKMYQKNLFLSALLHNLSSLDVKKLAIVVNDCRTKIEQLEETCRQSNAMVEPKTRDVSTDTGNLEEQKHEMVNTAVGDENVNTKEAGIQNNAIEKIDSQTETAYFGIDAGVQASEEEDLRGCGKPEDSIGSEEQWNKITAGISNADYNSLSLCQSYLLEPFLMQLEDSSKLDNNHEVTGISTDHRLQEAVSLS